MRAVLVLDRIVYDAMLDHARADAPVEACGVLIGEQRTPDTVVEVGVRLRNVADSPRVGYRIDPSALLEVFDEAATVGREVVGFYHSHPVGPPTPSDRDREDAHWPGYLYVIVSLSGSYPSLDGWHWTGETFTSVPVRVRE